MKTSIHFGVFLLLTWLGLMPLVTVGAPPAYNLQVGVGTEDTGATDDSFQQLTASVRSGRGLTRKSALNLNADIYTRRFSDLDRKDKDGLLLEAVYNFIPTPGFTKPVYSIALRQEFERFDNSANDTSQTSLLLIDSFRIDENLSFVGGIEVSDLSSDLIDSSIAGLFAGLDYWAGNQLLLYGSLKLQTEDNTLKLGPASRPAARDAIAASHLPSEPGFQGGVGGAPSSGSDSDSDNRFITLGINYAIDARQSIDFSYENLEYDTATTITIDQVSLDYFFRF